MIAWVLEPLQFGFMQRALLVAVVAGSVGALLSCWLTLVGWSLMGDAVSHAVLPGVVLSYIVGIPFGIGAFVFGAGAVGLIGLVRRTSRVKEDAAIGVVFTGLFALGLILISRTPSDTDLSHILFGNLLGLSVADVVQIVVLGLVTIAVVALRRRDFTLVAFDRVHAHAVGIDPRRVEALLLGLLALAVVVALQAVGIVLVVAVLIIPRATAFLLTDRMERMLLLAVGVAVVAGVAGTYVSYYANVSTGGAVVVSLATTFALAYLFGPRHGVIARYLAGRRPAVQEPGARRAG
ncbi:Manganese ABC transporter, inner membrane permease protein SitD [Pseudonocardia sp. Ae168_Ps1]|uniref:metal ABC transporter permease n=1 Tax=unclassified Pseudonocardia TaxID=2619320 RepID=UPI00094B26BE|nr:MULTISPECIES: metal ABC transporter permease [unclassified Pseudonocardia]OLL76585.1 Manganese ABC transporter, inner membrane permease protein SitD [Pseudonocardia sp. Ae150A_Ps1]OLL82594.1 Manganese ABC transporter, inner membrane permease protein SitD [Pseudonocardia sp. Ae168_Ps1]OLL83291.1 Manganese ABC transporter, inner membrane permease protein SitD [Pseudonocardia sp. Ae263_Ps1]OLL90671.1 Manganese ABC transporter, inner membrane permease protein SitD [Pseudonocardia sp. Ae356_Ps1]